MVHVRWRHVGDEDIGCAGRSDGGPCSARTRGSGDRHQRRRPYARRDRGRRNAHHHSRTRSGLGKGNDKATRAGQIDRDHNTNAESNRKRSESCAYRLAPKRPNDQTKKKQPACDHRGTAASTSRPSRRLVLYCSTVRRAMMLFPWFEKYPMLGCPI